MTITTKNKIFCLSGFMVKPELIQKNLKQRIDFIDYLNLSEKSFKKELLNKKKKYELAIGFSLGACLTLKYHNLIKAKKILLIAPPANFISNHNNPFGKTAEDISSFISTLKEDPKVLNQKFNFNTSFPRRQIFKYLSDNNTYTEDTNKKTLLDWLYFLELFDASAYDLANKEIHILHGLSDNVVSYKQTSIFKKKFKNLTVKLIEDAPHALFLSHPEEFQDYVDDIINQ
ncbi:alpha/beta hydrolase [Rickettsiales bacterium]|nr:alpha/beta hydrolase [Rickettsiales bacterium]